MDGYSRGTMVMFPSGRDDLNKSDAFTINKSTYR